MNIKKYRWSRDYESAEEELIVLLKAQGVETERWGAKEGEIFESHAHAHDKRLWCAEGSIVFTINNRRYSIQPGDALELPAGTTHSAVAGISGCICYESLPIIQNPAV